MSENKTMSDNALKDLRDSIDRARIEQEIRSKTMSFTDAKWRPTPTDTWTDIPTMAEESPYNATHIGDTPVVYTSRSVLARRRQAGDALKSIDYPGFWIHLETDIGGIPRNPTLIEVNDGMAEWRIVGDSESRVMERLPKGGVFIFIW